MHKGFFVTFKIQNTQQQSKLEMTTKDLQANEYNAYYQNYINNAEALSLKEGLKFNHDRVLTFLEDILEAKHNYSYEEGKWTLKELLLHLIDTERIFVYRALCIAREDKTLFPGFDQDTYVATSRANNRQFQSLMNEYTMVRKATISLFDSFTDEMLMQIGTASNSPISARALGFIIMGHENHHCKIISERYL